jgi:hypothetical protein
MDVCGSPRGSEKHNLAKPLAGGYCDRMLSNRRILAVVKWVVSVDGLEISLIGVAVDARPVDTTSRTRDTPVIKGICSFYSGVWREINERVARTHEGK